jgi:drug/metabolite transporter (DMT)-like permease
MSVPAAYLGIILIWATTPLAIKWSSAPVGFVFGVTARMVLGTLLCLLIIAVLRIPFAWHRQARLSYFASALGIYGAMMCAYWGAQYISSGLVSVVYGLLPLVTTLLAALWLRSDLLQFDKLIGIALGVAGLLVIFEPQDGIDKATLMGVAGILASVLLHSISMLWLKRIAADVPPLALTGGGLSVALPFYLLTWWLLDGELHLDMPMQAGMAILYLGVVGSVIGFVLFYYVLKQLPADAIAIITLITPVLALIIGNHLNHEPLTLHVLVGAGLILAGLGMNYWGQRLLTGLSRVRP